MKKKVPAPKAIVRDASTGKLKQTLGIFIFAFAFILYAQSISFNYAADDDSVISQNKLTTKGLNGIPEILKTDYWHGTGGLQVPQYRPLPLLLLAVEWEFFPANPHISHFINVLLYAITCWLLFMLLCRLFETQNLIFPFAACLLFVAHPIHTEVVNNIKSRDEILCFLFAVWSCWFILKFVNQNKTSGLLGAGVCYFLSLLAKETSIAFVLLAPLMVFFFTNAAKKKISGIAVLYAVVTGIFLLVRAAVLANQSFKGFETTLNNSLYAAPDFISQKATVFYILLRYAGLLFFPHPLSYDYSFAQIKTQSLTDIGAIAGIVLYAAMGIYIVLNFRKKNIPVYGLLFYLFTLAPVSNLFILIGSPMAERLIYIPSLGFCMLVAYLLVKLFKAERMKSQVNDVIQFFSQNKSLTSVMLLVMLLYSVKTFSRSNDWKNDIALFSNDVKIATNSARAHYNWGAVLYQQLYPKENDSQKKNDILDKALIEFNQAISIYPKYADACINRGLIYKHKGDYKKAIENFETAKLHSRPQAGLYFDLGNFYLEDGQNEKAIEAFDAGLSLNTMQHEIIYNNKGIALFKIQRYEEAITAFQKAIELNPGFQNSYKNLGYCYMNLKQYPQAIDILKQAVKLDSKDIKAINTLVTLYKFTGDTLNARIYSEMEAGINR